MDNIFIRKRNLLFKSIIVIIFGFILLFPYKNSRGLLIEASFWLTSYLQSASFDVRRNISENVLSYIFLVNTNKQNRQLKAANFYLKARNLRLQFAEQENRNLRNLLNIQKKQAYSLEVAQVIGTGFLPRNHVFIIDKGKNHGIKKYQGVITSKGVVGYVFQTSSNHAKIITLLNGLTTIPAKTQLSNHAGLVEVYSGNLLIFKNFSLNNEEIKLEAKVITLNSDHFPDGLPIGQITEIKTNPQTRNKTYFVTPEADLGYLSQVFIIKNPHKKNYIKKAPAELTQEPLEEFFIW